MRHSLGQAVSVDQLTMVGHALIALMQSNFHNFPDAYALTPN